MSNNYVDDPMQNPLLGLFAQSQESLDEAKRKNASETTTKTSYFQFDGDGTYTVRILPLAPSIGPDGNALPMTRKGYEYPLKDIFLHIDGVDKKGKKVTRNIPVCHTRMVFPNLENDLIELYVRLACEANSGDKEFCDKISGNSFNGGLKYNAKRCMYVLDMNKRSKGLQILQLSYSQYRDLEDAKLRSWVKLASKNSNALCPISSPMGAYPVELVRKTENKKVSYTLNIDGLSEVDKLSAEELQMLLDAPRLPEALYVYRRFHLEATIAFLQQQDKVYNLNIMAMPEIKTCIEQIKMCLSADDQSHFSFGNDSDDEGSNSGKTSLEDLWAIYDGLEEKGLNDRTEEGQDLRSKIREFIEDNDLDIRVDRKKSNLAVLEEIQGLMENGSTANKAKEETARDGAEASDMGEDGLEEDEDLRRTRNDDTNEPAARSDRERRPARPVRRQ